MLSSEVESSAYANYTAGAEANSEFTPKCGQFDQEMPLTIDTVALFCVIAATNH